MAFSINPAILSSTDKQTQLIGKNRSPKSLTFEGVTTERFSTLNIAASQSTSTVQDAFALPNASRVLRVSLCAAAISGTPTIQVTNSAVTAAATIGLLANPNGNGCVTVTSNLYSGQTIPAAQQSLTLSSGTVLALRAYTGAGDTATGLRVVVEYAPVDEHPTQPLNHAFGPTDY
ncbi:MAG: hypothetical protein KGL39_08955 [Patescibacteria group bacterium]|nr:hypothetical protein [Patescibacteria group bacterium]